MVTAKSFTVYIELQAEGRRYEVPYTALQEDAWGRVSHYTLPERVSELT